MLRSLLIKKTLTYGNAMLVAFLFIYLALSLLRLPSGEVAIAGRDAVDANPPAVELAKLGAREVFDPIVESGLFGKNAVGKPAPVQNPVAKPVAKAKPIETTLPLKLIGTVVSGDDDPYGSAIIENKNTGASKKTYFVGDEVMSNVFLQSVQRRMVLLENKNANRIEQLFLEEAQQQFKTMSNARPRAAVLQERGDLAARIRASRPAVEGANRIFTFNRNDLVTELEAQYDHLASSVDVRLVQDANGKVQGVQATNLSSTPLAGKFGIEDGDVIQSVNGQQVESLDSLYDIVDKNQNSTTFRVQLLRGGRPQVFTYHLR